MDAADETAAKLLPCRCDPPGHELACPACYRPAVAAALRELNAIILRQSQTASQCNRLAEDFRLRWLKAEERIAALEAEVARLRAFVAKVPHLLPLNDCRHAYVVAAHAPSRNDHEEADCARLGGRCAWEQK